MSLIEETAEAGRFLVEAMKNVEELKIFPEENFKEVIPAVLGGTGIDLQGETIALGDLHRTAESIASGPFWVTVEHNPAIHPVGRVLVAKVFHSSERDMWFLAGLIGQYDPATFPSLSGSLGEDLPLNSAQEAQADEAHLSFNRFEIPVSTIQELIADAPPAISSGVYEDCRKSAEVVIAVLTLVVPGAWLTGFSKKFGEKVGEAVGEKLVEATGWLAHKAVRTLRKTISSPVLLLESEIAGCKVQFIIASTSEAEQIEAAESIPVHIDAAMRTFAQLASLQPQRLVFEYDRDRRKWTPSYAVTGKVGVITDKPYLAAIHASGLSLAGRVAERSALPQEPGS